MISMFDSTNRPQLATLTDILRWRALHSPQREAYTFLLDGETKQVQMTYAELDLQARRMAALLQDCTVVGDRVLLLYPPGLEYVAAVLGCFYAGVVAVPAYPPRLNQSLTRIQTILQDAQATVVLTISKLVSSLHRTFASNPHMQDLHWIETDTSDQQIAYTYRESRTDLDSLAFLQYTSGSTSAPKGVMLTHANLMQNAALIQEGMSLTPEEVGLSWLPPYHDMGLMAGILQALYIGRPTLLMTPAAFLQQPLRWLQAISSFHVTISGGPNFAYDLCVKKATPDSVKTLDLSSWTLAYTGAEPVRAETLSRFAETFAPCGFRSQAFYPCYGLAETTLFVSSGRRSEKPRIGIFEREAFETGHAVEATGDQEASRLLVSCGSVRQGQEVAIVDPDKHTRCAPGTIGEIWVKAPNVGQGYWGKEEETRKTFQAFLQGGDHKGSPVGRGQAAAPTEMGEGPFLRTGDLGFFVEEELYVAGRIKDLVIIRGRNLYPQDIEQVVEKSHPLLRQSCCAAFAVEGEGGEQLVVVQEVIRHADNIGMQEAIEAIRQAVLSAFDVEVSAIDLLRAGTIPKTTSGKIQRHACRSRFLAAELNTIHSFRRPPSSHANNADPSVRIEDVDEKGESRPMAQGTGAAQDTGQGLAPTLRGRFLVGTGVSSPPTRVLPRKTPVRARPSRPSGHGDDLSPKIPTPERLAPTLFAPTVPPLGSANGRGPTRQEIVDWLVRQISESALIDAQLIDIHAPFVKFNLNSLEVVSLSGDLEEWLRRSLSPTLLYDYPSIDALARYLASEDPAVVTNAEPVGEVVDQQHAIPAGAIAIVGLGCRFPGANNPAAFWQMLEAGIDGISEVPPTRWDATQFYAPDQATPGKMNTRWGGFLQDIEQFDPAFFALSPREAEVMDPQQRLLLEVAWETFEQAGLVPEKLAGSQTGVFIGISSSDYYALHHTNLDYHQAYTNAGSAHSIAANRLSYFFDFHGPSIAVDTSCSSSLVAVHQACQSLRNGECDLALAGGVNVLLQPEVTVAFSQARTMSSDGHCKTFDEEADGYVRSEGCGLVLLKSLEAAERDGDPILAIVRGSAVNQDGRSNGLAAPNGPSQEAVIRHALFNAGVSPSAISYVETHGSSTPLGDPIEVDALKAVLMQERSPDQACLLGAVKTNIGHLEAAAGIAGLIKTVLCLQKGVIAPNLHFKRLNPHISFAGTTFAIPTKPTPWPGSPHAQRFAGVSAFGFGGTNVHVVLEGPPPVEPNRRDNALCLSEPPPIETPNRRDNALCLSERPVHLLTLSARTTQALSVMAQHYADFLITHPTDRHKALSLRDLCYTAQAGRTHFAHRLAVSASNTEQLREHLEAFVAGEGREETQVGHVEAGQRRIAFLFPGQGCQYVNMARQLYDTQPAFRAALDECDRLLRPLLPQNQHRRDTALRLSDENRRDSALRLSDENRRDSALRLSGESNLLSILYPEAGVTSPLNETAYTQSALFALEYALAQMWLSWGIKPDVVMGHSMGEYVAACVAGLFSLEDGLKLIAARGRLMQALPEQGTMAVIFTEPEHIQTFIEPYAQHVSIAALNGPNNTVISGREEIVRLIVQQLEEENAAKGIAPIESAILTISQASHCPLVDPMLDAFEQVAHGVTFLPLRIPLICNLTGQLLGEGSTLDAGYWRRHTREAVQFATGIQTLSAHGCELFLELGPTPVLSKMGKHCLPTNKATWLTSLHQDHDDWHILMQSMAHLYTRGCNFNWSGLHSDWTHQHRRNYPIALPTYPFEREYCWFKSEKRDQRDRDTVSSVNLADYASSSVEVGNVDVLDGGKARTLTKKSTASLIDFGLIFFSSREGETGREQAPVYQLVTESARYADQHDFSSIWIPERHFTKEGWLYPNPALLISALAKETSHIHLRAGSVVAPLHHPLRIAEDWAVVDHLSGGRVGVSFASGWHPNDFALAPDHYADRSEVMYRAIEIVRKLWRGETVPFKGGDGKLVELKTYPLPLQQEIPIWLTAAGHPKTFANAGKLGADLLTHLYNQSVDELAEKIRIYRDARAEHGYDPATGKVSVMLHTYVGADMDTVRAQVLGPFSHYLQSASSLVSAIGYSRGQQVDLSRLSEQDLQDYLVFVTDRLIREQRILFGTPQTCAPLVAQLRAAGVDEIACQLDFGVENDLVLQNLPYLNQLREQSNSIVGAGNKIAGTGASPMGDRKGGLGLTQSGDGVNPSSTLRHGDAPEYSKNRGADEGLAPSRPLRSPVPTETKNEINTWLYQLRWQALDLPSLPGSTSPGHWLIFIDQKGIGQHLARQLQEQGHSCSLVEAGQTFQTIGQHHYRVNPANPVQIKQAVGTASQSVGTALAAVRTFPLRGVIHLWSLDATPVAATNSTTLETDQILSVQSALSLMQALIGESLQTRLWLITQGVQPVRGGEATLAIAQAPIWGLGKTCAIEHPEIWGGLIDLDPHISTGQRRALSAPTAAILKVLQGDLHEDQIALRGTKTYVARMERIGADVLQESGALHLSQDASYLITGGLWGLGLEVARWLATRGARHLILLGRSNLPPRETWDQAQPTSRIDRQIAGIRSIEHLGAQVYAASVDVTEEAQLAAFLHLWNGGEWGGADGDTDRGHPCPYEEGPPIRGIIHAASVWQDAQGQSLLKPLANLSTADLSAVLRPKMLGGWHLAQLLQETPLDFFVSFSSAASLLGSVGQGNYAAANEFLDILAYYQRAHGQPALSIDWGTIAEIGMGAMPAMLRVHEYWESHGLERLSPQQVLQALEVLIQGDLTRVGVLRLDWQLLQQFSPQMLNLPLVRQFVHGLKGMGDADHEETHNAPENGSRDVGVGSSPRPEQAQDTGQGQAQSLRTQVLQTLRDAPVQERHAILTLYIKEQIANILRLPVHRLDTEQPLTTLGFDSLMAIELRNRIDLDLQTRIPIISLVQGPSITQFVNHMLTLEGPWNHPVETVPSVCPSPTESSNTHFPLSHNQKALWFLSCLAPESAAYNVLYAARIQQRLDVAALRRVLQVLAKRYPVLTSTYTLQHDEPVQQIQPNQTLPLEEVDAPSAGLDDLKQLLLEESNRPIDPTKGPVCRLKLYRRADDDHVLGLIVHHIVADFRALEILVDELSHLYAMEKNRVASPIGTDKARPWPVLGTDPVSTIPDRFQNADYVRWQNSLLESEVGEQHWQYWQNELAGDLPVLNLPTDRPRPPVQTYKGASHSFSFGPDLVQKMRTLANIEKVTLFTLMLAAYQVLLHRYSDQDDILVGTPALGRTRSELEQVIGSLVNPVVVRAKLAHNPTFKDLLQQTKRGVLSALEHQDFPFPFLVERLQPHRDLSSSPLYQTLFIWDRHIHNRDAEQVTPGTGWGHASGLFLEPLVYGQQGAAFDLSLTVFEMADQLSADFSYNLDLFDPATTSRMAVQFLTLLDSIVNNPNQHIREISVLPAYELNTILLAWNATKTDHQGFNPWYPRDVYVHQLIEKQVEQTPDAIAVIFEQTALTYRELNAQANHLAHRLIYNRRDSALRLSAPNRRDSALRLSTPNRRDSALRLSDVGPEEFIGVCMERSLELVIALLAILKAGMAYVPLDPQLPQERLTFLLADAQVPVVLTQIHLLDLMRLVREQASTAVGTGSKPRTGSAQGTIPAAVEIICVEADSSVSQNGDNPACPVQPENLAYLIYTSGSTGKPKGVMSTHRGLRNRLLWMQETYQLTQEDRVLQKTPFSFDVSVWEFFWPLMTGARLIVALPGGHQDPAYLRKLIVEQQVTTLHFVPSMLQAFLREPLEKSWIENCTSLRQVICSGEALTPSLQARFFHIFAATGTTGQAQGTVPTASPVQLHNLYGPTEASIDVAFWPCEPTIAGGNGSAPHVRVPIGHPIANTQIYLLDRDLQPVPIGVPGELYIGGEGLARGYVNRPELTAERFIPNPFVGIVPHASGTAVGADGAGPRPVPCADPGSRLYRTGDLARYRQDGAIEYLGRNDRQVKLRGYRIELGEIEAALQTHPAIQEAVVILREDGSFPKKVLIAYVVPAAVSLEAQTLESHSTSPGMSIPTARALQEHLRKQLPDYMVPPSIVFLETLPLTPNGKLDRAALPIPDQMRPDRDSASMPARTPTEEILAAIWASVLSREQVGIHENFFALGGDSMHSIEVLSQARERGIHFSLQDLFRHQTIYELVQALSAESLEALQAVPTQALSLIMPQDRLRLPADVEDAYPLTMLQAGMVFHSRYDPRSAIYHDIMSYHLAVSYDHGHLQMALEQLAAGHPILRTSFDLNNFSEPLQLVHRSVTIPLHCQDLRTLSPTEQDERLRVWFEEEKSRSFVWAQPPLVRFQIHLRSEATFQLTLSWHHAVLDGWSAASLMTELMQIYLSLLSGDKLSFAPPPVLQFRDFVALERKFIASQETRQYWLEKLLDATSVRLPRWISSKQSADNAAVYVLPVPISQEVSASLKRIAQENAVPLKTVLLAAHLRVLSFMHGETDILTGLVSNGRPEIADGERTLGLFLNTLPFRLKLSGGTWVELIQETFAAECELLPHRWYPLIEIQKQKGVRFLFETLFNFVHFHVYQDLILSGVRRDGVGAGYDPYNPHPQDTFPFQILGYAIFERTNFPLVANFSLDVISSQIHLSLQCDTKELCLEQIEAIGSYYAQALVELAAEPYGRYEHQTLHSAHEQSLLPVPVSSAQHSEGYVAPRSELEHALVGIWQQVLDLEQVGISDNFFDLGGHSILLMQVQSQLQASLSYEVSMVDLFKYPTIRSLATYLSEQQKQQPVLQPITERVRKRKRVLSTEEQLASGGGGIAIVGVAGRFPGANNIDEFWHNICHGVESISFFSEEELLASGIEPELIHNPRYVKAHGVLDGVEYFAASFFGYSPKEAAMMDPQQRFFLECAWEVLEQAGYDADTYQGLIGVYAGQSVSTYMLSYLLANRALLAEAETLSALVNNAQDFLATRASYKLNLKGPAMTIQTACSTSLVAVHTACQSLLHYECDMALAGGASIRIPQKVGYLHEEGGILSPDGHCRAFDATARGTVGGSGVGIVALKRLADALADGDTIYAVIRGSAISNDGAAKVGYTAPSVEGQVNVIAEAIAMAGIESDTISYVEMHGTGTTLGDPIEVAALIQAFRSAGTGLAPVRHCAIGSVKTNLGHLDAAAGITGLIKTVLALKHGMLPPSLHFHHPNPKIDFANSPFYINTHLTEWKHGNTPRRAGVSSFGIGGTNAHVILEEAPLHVGTGVSQPKNGLSANEKPLSAPPHHALPVHTDGPHLVVLSAKTASALETMTVQLAAHVQSHPDAHLNDIAYTLQVGRKSFPHRQAFVAQNRADLLHLLENPDSQSVFKGFVSPDIPVTISTEDQTVLLSLRHPQSLALDRAFLLNTCGRLWCAGMTIDWSLLYEEDSQQQRIPLPTYPFERERYWIDAQIGTVGYGTSSQAGQGPALSAVDPVRLSTVGTTTHQRPNLETDYVPPQNETQQQIVAICQKLLGIEPIGIHDDFFDLGGDSLLGTQLITQLCDTFQVDLSLLTVFEASTVADIALMILQKKAELADDALLLKDLEQLEQLTDDEVQALLTVDRNQTGRVEKI